ncbi:accessory Sec system S-layer assembly protein [Bacillus cihuensis]|uniref:accessory Sec system S-layer assembly protein n=1 Tax=Bacillus cihuensis TaxID=1208599 RepID=UPI0004051221|nr:accessory Sec system S-layer assembly protein [Bacillus cihuensis]
MVSIFKKKINKLKKEGKDSIISSGDLLNETDVQTDEEIITELSIHPEWNLSSEQNYVYRFLNNELAPLKPNQISLSGIELRPENNEVAAIAFVRNSLNKAITFEEVKLLLLDENKETIASHSFDMSVLGELPARSSRPWMFVFPADTVLKKDFSTKNWTIAFELKAKHRLDLAESWEKGLPEAERKKLKKYVEQIDPPREGEVNFLGLQAKKSENGDLHVTILIRNGHNKNVKIEKLPLEMIDASKEVVAKGGFSLDDLEIKANTTKPWTFIFPAAMVLKADMDLSTWSCKPVQS